MGARQRRGFSPVLLRATRSRPNSGEFSFFFYFSFLRRLQVNKTPTCDRTCDGTVASGRFADLRRLQVGKMGKSENMTDKIKQENVNLNKTWKMDLQPPQVTGSKKNKEFKKLKSTRRMTT